ncbi:hypothetical protein, partial [Vibrio vulnificus]|uniref:hypothetical protein n=1 Tax=Vibrio vulnificus TaxID=672 RepID=UPI001ED9C04E
NVKKSKPITNYSYITAIMEKKGAAESILMMVVLLIVLTMPAVTEAHLPQPAGPGACISHCLKDCKLKGVITAACVKYCPVHCLPPNPFEKEHICNISCMLDTCAKYYDDEKKMTDCVFECSKVHCKNQH